MIIIIIFRKFSKVINEKFIVLFIEENTMKYLFVNASLTDGGSERVMAMLANQFADSGLDTSMLLLREKEVANYTVSPNLKCHQLHYGTSNKLKIFLKRFRQVRRYVKEYQPDAIISLMWDINIFTLIACLGLRSKIIVSERGYPKAETNNELEKLWKEFGQSYVYLLANRIVLQTAQVRQYYRPAVQKKCVVIPNPISPNLPEVWDKEREKRIVAAGRFTAQKNFPMLIRAFAAFHAVHPDYELVIYGEGSLRAKYIKLINELNVSDCVKLPGYVSDVNDRMRSAAMYVSSSDFEGISNAMLEALAMGVPSICTDCPVGGAAMAIQNGENGVLIPVGDEQALYQQMCRLAENHQYAKKISENSLKVKEEYSVEKIANEWIRIINEE